MSLDVDRIAERKIQEAIEEGLFDDLPGKGKPLDLDDDPLTPPHLRLCNRVLKNANALPDWVELGRDIGSARLEGERIWRRIEREYPKRRSASNESDRARLRFGDWYTRTRNDYLASLTRVNSDILKFNLVAPQTAIVHIPFKLEEETNRFAERFPSPTELHQTADYPPVRPNSILRDAAACLYRARSERDRNP